MQNTQTLTAAQALDILLTGNQRFADGDPKHPNQDAAYRATLVPGQHPFAVVFGCSDSRLAAEILFDRGLGDLFVVRTAGHVLGPEVLGSIEYGVAQLGCPLVVVLGHEACGAVRAARATVEEGVAPAGYVRDVVERVTPSVLAARAVGLSEEADIVNEHIRHTVDLLLDRSPELVGGRAAVVGLSYHLGGGQVRLVTSRGPDDVAAA
ncbi:carbonic anhydrase [Streptomyces sp. SA15]|uniref:carbonic anhydrase n=1 Tax=Streptomyces sp. SA15 TaxID=934019 RepID=UPI000BAE9387|nr:carbonic anhydrase [Streptomyces sp. SA15]PAZ12534.1 carbonic anhydrase [Streptomyces sp. SA15]